MVKSVPVREKDRNRKAFVEMIIFSIACGVATLYALLSIFASIVQFKTAKKKDAPLLMTGGGILILTAVVLRLISVFWSWAVLLSGGVLISAAALLNGKRSGTLHVSHHIIRACLTAALTVGFFPGI